MLPPGKNSGRTTKESVENASRAPPTSSTAASPSSARSASPKAGRKMCWISSADIAPAAAVAHHDVGLSRSGSGQVQPSKSESGGAVTGGSANGGHLPGARPCRPASRSRR